jgi:hypothetical protein
MAQHDYNIANQTFPATRSDINNALGAIVSLNSGATAPSSTFAYMLWYDTANDILKVRNAGNDAWIDLFTFDQSADTVAISGISASDVSGLGTSAVLDETTSAQWRSNVADKILSTDQVWGAMAEVTLTDGANIAVDLGSGFDFTVTLGGNRTLSNPTNTKVGQRGRIRVVQDGTGSRTLAYGSNYEFAGGTAPTLTTTAGAEDVLYYDVISATRILVSFVGDIS